MAVSFWDFLRPPAPTKAKGAAPQVRAATAAELQTALDEARLAATAAAESAAECAAERQNLLLAGTDDQVTQADINLASANRAVDRAEAAIAALEQRLAEARENERQADLDRVFAAGEDALARGLDGYRRYAEAARRVVEIVGEIKLAAVELDHSRRLLRERGDPRVLPDLDTEARPERSGVQLLRSPLWAGVRLPAHDHPQSTIYPVYVAPDIPPMVLPIPPESIAPPPEPLAAGMVRWPG